MRAKGSEGRPQKNKHSGRAGAGGESMYPPGEERGSALVQESLESRSQDAKLACLLVKLEEKRPKSKVKLPSKI